VLAIGWLLGGTVGVGTVLFAVGIGPLVQFFLPLFETTAPRSPWARDLPEEGADGRVTTDRSKERI
jgi:hypothetical protein